MKNFCKKVVQKILKILVKAILRKYQPEIIGVTGSVGKTSAKEAIYSVLSPKFNVRRNIKNYNNEIGLPLTIIGASSGGRTFWGWLGVFVKAAAILVWKEKRYPEILILEMAVDREGDMDYLVDLAPPKIGVITNISPVHLEFFKSLEKITEEKSKIVSRLPRNGWAVFNFDNKNIREIAGKIKNQKFSYGIENSQVDLKALEISFYRSERGYSAAGLNFKLNYQGSTVPVFLPKVLGEHLIYAALAGAAVGLIYGINLVEISQSLRLFQPPPGRTSLIEGIKGSLIIDDSYNAGPDSVMVALDLLGRLKAAGKKFAVLGDMLELGAYTDEAHRKVGKKVVDNKADVLITIGERARTIAAEAQRQGMDTDDIFVFSDVGRAGRFLQERIAEGDLILVKASQGIRLEKIVKEIMAEPLKAKRLLVRQEKPWG